MYLGRPPPTLGFIMDQQLLDLYHRFVGMAFDRQMRFAEFLERKAPGAQWAFENETATLRFGPKLKFEAPLVGSHTAHNNSWMWAWANRTMKLSITNRALGDTIRAFAHKAMVPELAMPVFPIEQVIGTELTEHACHVFGTLLVGELDYDAYYLAPYDGGRSLLLIRDDRLRSTEKHPLARVLSAFPKLLAALPVNDHRTAFTSYAHSYGLKVGEEEAGLVKVAGHEKGELTATFDDSGRLSSLKGSGVSLPKPKAVVIPKKKPRKKPAPAKSIPKAVAKVKAKPVGKKKALPKKKPGKKR